MTARDWEKVCLTVIINVVASTHPLTLPMLQGHSSQLSGIYRQVISSDTIPRQL